MKTREAQGSEAAAYTAEDMERRDDSADGYVRRVDAARHAGGHASRRATQAARYSVGGGEGKATRVPEQHIFFRAT
eukprot:CAMPEP_0198678920 /NCGR_PEP_ID=MMETSP1468-20131203/1778_1 /TAXON_ID=1461545 /ORGANISM="Mantoniella sp, Strain CCMP1436" /LENGTH=75 /DNA_ID=CAMNT_0044416937 /DNA_START=209 /DNA_END=436 /DNA_ORIENTATION=+